MKWPWRDLTGTTSVGPAGLSTGNVTRFSRPCGEVVPIRHTGRPSPNSAAAEQVRRFLEPRLAGELKGIADGEGRDRKRIYNEAEGEAVLSWDLVDRGGARLSLEDRVILARFLMDRWGLSVTVGRLPGLEG